MKSIHNFVISRAKISRSSIKVNDLFFTYNGENLQEDLIDVVEVANEKFSDLNDLNGATMNSLIHLFNEDEIKTCYFMCAVSLIGKIDDKEFKLDFSSKRGSFLTVKTISADLETNNKDIPGELDNKDIPEETKSEEVNDKNVAKDIPGELDENPDEIKEVNDKNVAEDIPEETKSEEVNDKDITEEPKEDKKKLKDDKKKKAVKEASDKL